MRVLSIDWDYFVEEDPMLDMGHQETILFLNTMWNLRAVKTDLVDGKIVTNPRDLSEMLPFRGDERTIERLPCLRSRGYNIAVAESHLSILELLKDEKQLEIVNIDAHHDLGYGSHDRYHFEMNEPDCGNWGQLLISQDRVKSWSQIYPEWRRKFPEGGQKALSWARKRLGCRFHVSTQPPVLGWRSVDQVFICRSGCWTPPVYDERFNAFCRSLGATGGLPVRTIEPIELEDCA